MKYKYSQKNGNVVIERESGEQCSINEKEYPEDWAEVEAYLADHPEALVPEPAPPEPSPEELAAQARARALADLAALDARAIRPLRAIEAARKITTDEIAAAKAKDPPDLAEVAAAEARLDAVLKAEGAELARIETEAETIRKGI